MIRELGRRLLLVFSQPRNLPDPPPPASGQPESAEVELVAYAEDCILSGRLRLDAERLSDLLNDHDEYELVDVLVEPLVDGTAVEAAHVVVERDDLLLVHATGPRGNPARRTRTRPHPVALRIGPYQVRGYVHVPPGSHPIGGFRRRRTMVPLTDAWIEYSTPTGIARRRVSTVIVNRHVVDWIVEADDEEIELPDLPVGPGQGRLVKDFTGQLMVDFGRRQRG